MEQRVSAKKDAAALMIQRDILLHTAKHLFLTDLECRFMYNVDKSEQEDETCLLCTMMVPLFLL